MARKVLSSEDAAKRHAALTKANVEYYNLVERINQAARDGYDVQNPDVLSDALRDVACEQAGAEPMGFVEQCEAFAKQYAAHRVIVDFKFPRRPDTQRG
jgi:hypothetical protein